MRKGKGVRASLRWSKCEEVSKLKTERDVDFLYIPDKSLFFVQGFRISNRQVWATSEGKLCQSLLKTPCLWYFSRLFLCSVRPVKSHSMCQDWSMIGKAADPGSASMEGSKDHLRQRRSFYVVGLDWAGDPAQNPYFSHLETLEIVTHGTVIQCQRDPITGCRACGHDICHLNTGCAKITALNTNTCMNKGTHTERLQLLTCHYPTKSI